MSEPVDAHGVDQLLRAERLRTVERIRDRIFGLGGFYVPDPEDDSEDAEWVPVIKSWGITEILDDEAGLDYHRGPVK